MERLTLYMGIVHLGGAFEVSTTRIQVHLYNTHATNLKVVVELDLSVGFPVIIKPLQVNHQYRWEHLNACSLESIPLER